MPIRNRPAQNGAQLLDFLIDELGLKNDAALAKHLSLTAPQICKMRSGLNAVSGDTLLLIHDVTGLSISTLRANLLVPEQSEELAPA